MKTFKQYLTEEMDKKDQKYFLDQLKKLKDNFNKWYDQAEDFCRELHYEGTLNDKAESLLDYIEDVDDKIIFKLDNLATTIKRS